MSQGSLPSSLLDGLPPELVEAYDLGDLFSGTYDGVTRWVIRRSAEWLWGDVLGGAWADWVLAEWPDLPLSTPRTWPMV